jgi:peptide/nickel transport system substrate-binding protein
VVNNIKAPFDDPNFRLALSYAIDRDLLAKQVFQGFLDPSSLPTPRIGWWFDAETDKTLGYDPAKAAAYLAKSKYASGARFKMNVATDPYMLDMRDASLAIQMMLGAIGITVDIVPMETNAMIAGIVRGGHQATLALLASPGDPSFILQGAFTKDQSIGGGVNYQSNDIADLLKQVFGTTDPKVQLPIYHAIQKLIAAGMPVITLGYASASALWRERVHGFKVSKGITMNVSEVVI